MQRTTPVSQPLGRLATLVRCALTFIRFTRMHPLGHRMPPFTTPLARTVIPSPMTMPMQLGSIPLSRQMRLAGEPQIHSERLKHARYSASNNHDRRWVLHLSLPERVRTNNRAGNAGGFGALKSF